MEKLDSYGLKMPEVLLPADGTDLNAWAVIACDQYTQDREYWKRCSDKVGDKPSTLNIILPEVYLNDPDKQNRIDTIHENMNRYLKDGVFKPAAESFIYIERTTAYGRTRKGLIAALDLEDYEWEPFTKAPVRATEATILERIPPRMEIRRGAPLESPHIMLLANDDACALVEKTGAEARKKAPAYEAELMENSGSIKGWLVDGDAEKDILMKALENLKKKSTASDGSFFLFAVGDGNHSLATAKAVWNEFKEKNGGIKGEDGRISIPEGLEDHNARYALVEIVNIYDEGLTFEPIHRVLFNISAAALKEALCQELGGTAEICGTEQELDEKVSGSTGFIGLVAGGEKPEYILIKTDIKDLMVSRLQPVLDDFLKKAPSTHVCVGEVCRMVKPEIDYIHGADEVFRLGVKEGTAGLLLPPVAKDSFFSTIAGNGPLPRKSFSMGEASEKRFYFECRTLF